MSVRLQIVAVALPMLALACGPSVELVEDTTTSGESTTGDPAASTSAPATVGPTITSAGEAEATSLDGTGEPPAVCGDGIVTQDESCDDANGDPYDGCNAACRIPGELVWETTLEGTELTGVAIGADAVFASVLTYDLGEPDAPWIAGVLAFDAAGATAWAWSDLGYTAFDGAIAAKSDGGVLVSGGDFDVDGTPGGPHLRAFSAGGRILWTTPHEQFSGRPFALPDGGVTMADHLADELTSVLRLDAAGTSAWPAPVMLPGAHLGVAVTPDGGFVLRGVGIDDLVMLGSDGAVVWTAPEPDVSGGWVRGDVLEVVAGYDPPRLVTYALDGTRIGERDAPAIDLRAVPGGGYLSQSMDVFTRWDDELEPRWQIDDAWETFLYEVDATRLVVGGPLPPPGEPEVPIRLATIAL